MPISVRVHGDSKHDPVMASAVLTLDAPRVLLGRGEGCDIRLPDPSVSHRHASIRQRGSDYVLVDEGSTNGTRIGPLALTPHAVHTLRPREIVRVGKMWVELVVGSDMPTRGAPLLAKEIALDIVLRSLEKDGDDGRPRIRVEEGPNAGAEVVVPRGACVVIGRSREATFSIDEAEASRRHVEIKQRGDVLVVKDLGSKAGTLLGDRAVGSTDMVWRRGEALRIGATVLQYEFDAAEALAEIERLPDSRIPAAELRAEKLELSNVDAESVHPEDASSDEGLAGEPVSADGFEGSVDSEDEDAAHYEGLDGEADEWPTEGALAAEEAPPRAKTNKSLDRSADWSLTDYSVVLLALGVFVLSAVGYWVLLR